MNREKIANLRQQYGIGSLELSDLVPDPIQQFQSWLDAALEYEVPEPNAMTLATVSSDNIPSARIVLLKGLDARGLIFYTNYNSQKAMEIENNPMVGINFLWHKMERQIRIQGKAERLSASESEQYFQSRPKGSQIGAWSSPQSEVIDSRDVLEEKAKALKKQYAADSVLPKPPHWGGYLIRPTAFEFWQGRASRLHDRFVYTLQKDGSYVIERLAP